jgi:hypothetical protein
MTEALLPLLRRYTNHRDLAFVRECVLLEELQIGPGPLRTALRSLVADGTIEVLSPLPFLVVKWSGTRSRTSENGQKQRVVEARHSYSFHNNAIDKSKAIAPPSAGRGGDLLRDILRTLGETDPTTFRGALEHYPEKHIRAVLERIRATPPERLRKSKTALFRFLLAKTKSNSPRTP